MSGQPKSILWPAEKHTIAKIAIVKRYSYVWATILGATFKGQPLTYIDGFAGPGKYTNHEEGSPLAALRSLKDARANAAQWLAGDIRLLFIEKDAERCDTLASVIGEEEIPTGIIVKRECTDFITGMASAERTFGRAFATSAPLLVFVDPFGATGAPFSTVSKILSSKTSEVIINFDADGVERIRSAGAAADADRHLTTIFGSETWRAIAWDRLNHRQRCIACARLYKECLLRLPNVDYAFMFEMGESTRKMDYFLLFASQHARGLEKMKEVMRAIDQTGDFKFYDTMVGQEALFKFDQPEFWIEPLCRTFRGQSVDLSMIKKWILNETPFFNFKRDILKPALVQGLIEVIPRSGMTVTRGQFPEDKVKEIRFVGGSSG